jgi:hypothetical protein
MIIVGLKGGLGNQMFQYAAARRLAHKTSKELWIDTHFFNSNLGNTNVTPRKYELFLLNIVENIATCEQVKKFKNVVTRGTRKMCPWLALNPYVREKYFHFEPSVLSLTGNKYLDGHWMSERYFADIAPTIRQEFTFKNELKDTGRQMLFQIQNSNSICIQIRRGDYISNPQISKIHQTTSLDYFLQGVDLIKSRVPNPVFFIFSDDPEWCELNLKNVGTTYFVEREFADGKVGDYLQLMIWCKHFIISNSTFAWWGAWLSSFSEKIVVAPKKWFNTENINTDDIYPSSWIKI